MGIFVRQRNSLIGSAAGIADPSAIEVYRANSNMRRGRLLSWLKTWLIRSKKVGTQRYEGSPDRDVAMDVLRQSQLPRQVLLGGGRDN